MTELPTHRGFFTDRYLGRSGLNTSTNCLKVGSVNAHTTIWLPLCTKLLGEIKKHTD